MRTWFVVLLTVYTVDKHKTPVNNECYPPLQPPRQRAPQRGIQDREKQATDLIVKIQIKEVISRGPECCIFTYIERH